jgi:CRISPR-associated protein Csx3
METKAGISYLPAIAIGGPPHSGKSVLTYSLTQLLREQRMDHYVLRACPDGEGDWSNEATPATVQAIRRKGKFTATFIDNVCGALQRRHLPLLVDVGGQPTQADEAIFRQCTHLIILSSTPEGLTEWRAFAERLHLPIIAELDSVRQGEEALYDSYPLLRGRLSGLERGTRVRGTIMAHLAGVVWSLFALKPGELRQLHLDMAPVELAVDLERVGGTLNLMQGGHWQPAEIPAVLDYLPAQTPLALYGRGTNWLYAAVALHTWPAEFHQFDARLGWTKPTLLQLAATGSALLHWTQTISATAVRLQVSIPDTYLDYEKIQGSASPRLPVDRGLILDGKLPYWLLTGLAQSYRDVPWLAIYQPQVGDVVVMSRQPEIQVGSVL